MRYSVGKTSCRSPGSPFDVYVWLMPGKFLFNCSWFLACSLCFTGTPFCIIQVYSLIPLPFYLSVRSAWALILGSSFVQRCFSTLHPFFPGLVEVLMFWWFFLLCFVLCTLILILVMRFTFMVLYHYISLMMDFSVFFTSFFSCQVSHFPTLEMVSYCHGSSMTILILSWSSFSMFFLLVISHMYV